MAAGSAFLEDHLKQTSEAKGVPGPAISAEASAGLAPAKRTWQAAGDQGTGKFLALPRARRPTQQFLCHFIP